MENMIIAGNATSPILSTTPGSTRAFGMPMPAGGCAFGSQRISATGLSFVTTPESVIRDRKDLAAKGHVALVAYVPGYHAWSPPIC